MFSKKICYPALLAAVLVSCGSADTVLENISSSHSGIAFRNDLPDNEKINPFLFANYYNGGGVATGDINNDGLPDIYFTANAKGGNKLYLNKGDFKFEDITAKAGVAGTADWCTGVTMADVNADGYLDIYVSAVTNKLGLEGRNQLFINNGNETFTEKAQEMGLGLKAYSCQAVFFDYDRDGDLDCFVLNQSDKHNATIVDTSFRRQFDANAGDYLFQNNLSTTGKFTDVSKKAGISQSKLGFGLGLAVADINNDGWDDIYVGNDFHENDYYYVNNGDGTLTESGAAHFEHYSRFSMGNDIADYDNDGQLDILTVDMLPADEKILKTYGSDERIDVYDYKISGHGYQNQYSRNCLQRNNGDGKSFSDVALVAGVAATDWSWSGLMNDFDNDGNKDIFITSGIIKRTADLDYAKFRTDIENMGTLATAIGADKKTLERIPDGASYCYMFTGDGSGGFADQSKPWGLSKHKGYFNGASYADFDNDGDLDIVVNALNGPATLSRNNSSGRNYLSVKFEGEGANKMGIGAKAYIYVGGGMQYQQLMLTRGFQSSVEARLHFGLADAALADSIVIVWPDQRYQVLKNVKSNQQLIIKQRDAGGVFEYKRKGQPFADISAQTGVDWRHRENRFTDFNSQYLIPRQQSTRGPGMSVADVNNDGFDDLFVCGAKGQSGVLFIQREGDRFSADSSAFVPNKNFEGVASVFFDADKDGDADLYVASGGNEGGDGDSSLADHLYLNDGKGIFSEAMAVLPELYFNKSTVSAADVDKDGDIDLFIGVLADAKKYGYPKTSYLLVNDGKGRFSVAEEKTINLKDIGIVTASAFSDVNSDGWPDLIVTGEWMPVKIYLNKNGVFSVMDISNTTGLWQTVYPADVNGDGNIDILAGNWGHNTKLWSGKNGPVKLYVKDFDRNGSIEQIMCYTIDGQEYPFLPKDELEQTLPVLKKGYLTYSEVAGKTVQFMFDDLFTDYLELKAEVLGSSCFFGDGKGGFTRVDLPQELQLAPIFAFTEVYSGGFIAGGNFYGVLPYEGRYDALVPTMFSYNRGASAFERPVPHPLARGEVRGLFMLNNQQKNPTLVVARNNKPLVFLKEVN